MNKIISGLLLSAAALFALPAFATPTTQTINLGTVYAGYTPDGPAPWLQATFTYNIGDNTGTLNLQSLLSDSNFVQGTNKKGNPIVAGWAFNLGQALSADPNCTSGACAVGVDFNSSGVFANGPAGLGTFNLIFGWSSQNRFDGTDSADYTLTFGGGLTGNPFLANTSGWTSVAHIQGITGGCSGWIVSGDGALGTPSGPCTSTPPPTNVPEPADLAMFGFGLLLTGLFLGLRRRSFEA